MYLAAVKVGLNHRRPGPMVAPLGNIVIDRAIGPQVRRQQIPLATAAVLRQDGVEHFAPSDLTGTPTPAGCVREESAGPRWPLVRQADPKDRAYGAVVLAS